MEIKERYDVNEETTTLWDDYQNGLSYQASSGLSKKLPEFVRFYEGMGCADKEHTQPAASGRQYHQNDLPK